MAATLKQYSTPLQQDALMASNSAVLPNAANTVNTSVIDLQTPNTGPFPTTGRFGVQIATTLSTGANSKNINCTIADSADNITFTNIAACPVEVIAGNAANFPASTFNVSLPPSTRRYIRVTATGEANGGNASDGTITGKLLF
jgi:hypothetical protein